MHRVVGKECVDGGAVVRLVTVCVVALCLVAVLSVVYALPPTMPWMFYIKHVKKIVHIHHVPWLIWKLFKILRINVTSTLPLYVFSKGRPIANITIINVGAWSSHAKSLLDEAVKFANDSIVRNYVVAILNVTPSAVNEVASIEHEYGSKIVPVLNRIETLLKISPVLKVLGIEYPSYYKFLLVNVSKSVTIPIIVISLVVYKNEIDPFSLGLAGIVAHEFARFGYLTIILLGKNLENVSNREAFLSKVCKESADVIIVEPSLGSEPYVKVSRYEYCYILQVPRLGALYYEPLMTVLQVYYPNMINVMCLSLNYTKMGYPPQALNLGNCGAVLILPKPLLPIPSSLIRLESERARYILVASSTWLRYPKSIFKWINTTGQVPSSYTLALGIAPSDEHVEYTLLEKKHMLISLLPWDYPIIILLNTSRYRDIASAFTVFENSTLFFAGVSFSIYPFAKVSPKAQYTIFRKILVRTVGNVSISYTRQGVELTMRGSATSYSYVSLWLNHAVDKYSNYLLLLDLEKINATRGSMIVIELPFTDGKIMIINNTVILAGLGTAKVSFSKPIRAVHIVLMAETNTYPYYVCMSINESMMYLGWTCINVTVDRTDTIPLKIGAYGNASLVIARVGMLAGTGDVEYPYPPAYVIARVVAPRTFAIGRTWYRVYRYYHVSLVTNDTILKARNATASNNIGAVLNANGSVIIQARYVMYPALTRLVLNRVAFTLYTSTTRARTLIVNASGFARICYINNTCRTYLLGFVNITFPNGTRTISFNRTVTIPALANATFIIWVGAKLVGESATVEAYDFRIGMWSNDTSWRLGTCIDMLLLWKWRDTVGCYYEPFTIAKPPFAKKNVTKMTVDLYFEPRGIADTYTIFMWQFDMLPNFTNPHGAGYSVGKYFPYTGMDITDLPQVTMWFPYTSIDVYAFKFSLVPAVYRWKEVPTLFIALAGANYSTANGCVLRGSTCVRWVVFRSLGFETLLVNTSLGMVYPVMVNVTASILNMTVLDRLGHLLPFCRMEIVTNMSRIVLGMVTTRHHVPIPLPSGVVHVVCKIGNITLFELPINVGEVPSIITRTVRANNSLVTVPYCRHVRVLAWTSNVTVVRVIANVSHVLSRYSILASGHGNYCLAVAYLTKPSNVTVSTNMTVSKIAWINRTLMICGTLHSTINITLTDRYWLVVVVRDMLGHAMPNITVMINGTVYRTDRNGTVRILLPAGWYIITYPLNVSGFMHSITISNATRYETTNNTAKLLVANVTVLDLYYRVPVRIMLHVKVRERGLNVVVVEIDGKVADAYSEPVPNATVLVKVINEKTHNVTYVALVRTSRDGTFKVPTVALSPETRYVITASLTAPTNIYVPTTVETTYTTPSGATPSPSPAPTPSLTATQLIILVVLALALVGALAYILATKLKKRHIIHRTITYA